MEGAIYYQIDGVAMGSSLGPMLVNFFMGYYETLWLKTFWQCKIICRDDMLMILYVLLSCESDADNFFEFWNTQHPNVKFAFEKQVNKQSSFLDFLVTIDGN